jgi:transposase
MYGFIIPCCATLLREETEESTGTVDTEFFVEWVEKMLISSLGSYAEGQPRSIVVMDNCLLHLDARVRRAIEQKGALLVYLPPYSPDYNPIEEMFSVYKAYLKRNATAGNGDWRDAHYAALSAVTPEKARNQFRDCCIRGMEQVLGPDEGTTVAIVATATVLMVVASLLVIA